MMEAPKDRIWPKTNEVTKNPPFHGNLALIKLVNWGTLLRAFKLANNYPIGENTGTIANNLSISLGILFGSTYFRGVMGGKVATMGVSLESVALLVGLFELDHIDSDLIFFILMGSSIN